MVGLIDEIKVHYEGFGRILPRSFSQKIWQPSDSRIQEAIRIAKTTFAARNDALVRIDHFEYSEGASGATVLISTGLTDYASHAATRLETDPANRANALYLSAVVAVGDMLVFGKAKNVARGAGDYNVAARPMRPSDVSERGVIDIKVGIDRMLQESFFAHELGRASRPFLIFGTQTEPAPSVLYHIALEQSRKEFTEHFNSVAKKVHAPNAMPKFDDLRFVPNDPAAFERELRNSDVTYRPHVRALFKYAVTNKMQL